MGDAVGRFAAPVMMEAKVALCFGGRAGGRGSREGIRRRLSLYLRRASLAKGERINLKRRLENVKSGRCIASSAGQGMTLQDPPQSPCGVSATGCPQAGGGGGLHRVHLLDYFTRKRTQPPHA